MVVRGGIPSPADPQRRRLLFSARPLCACLCGRGGRRPGPPPVCRGASGLPARRAAALQLRGHPPKAMGCHRRRESWTRCPPVPPTSLSALAQHNRPHTRPHGAGGSGGSRSDGDVRRTIQAPTHKHQLRTRRRETGRDTSTHYTGWVPGQLHILVGGRRHAAPCMLTVRRYPHTQTQSIAAWPGRTHRRPARGCTRALGMNRTRAWSCGHTNRPQPTD